MRAHNIRYSAMPGVSRGGRTGTRASSGTGGHVGGQDVVRVAVEVVAGSVVPHRGAQVGVAGGDLDVSQVDARVEHGRDKCVAQHSNCR